MIDASQYVPHLATDVQAWGADFAAFTGHKMCGPTGIGVLWGTTEILEATPPFLTGGEMILNVTKEGFTPERAPVEVRGRYAADRRGGGARRRGRLPRGPRHGRRP